MCDETDRTVQVYTEVWQKLELGKGEEMQEFKIKMWKEILWKIKSKLAYHLKEILNMVIGNFAFTSDDTLNLILR